MALTPKQIAELLKLRGLGWSQAEIAEKLETSQQVIGYQLKKLKKQSKEKEIEELKFLLSRAKFTPQGLASYKTKLKKKEK